MTLISVSTTTAFILLLLQFPKAHVSAEINGNAGVGELTNEFDCTTTENGYFAPKNQVCSRFYYECRDKSAYKLTCKFNWIFNKELETCNLPEDDCNNQQSDSGSQSKIDDNRNKKPLDNIAASNREVELTVPVITDKDDKPVENVTTFKLPEEAFAASHINCTGKGKEDALIYATGACENHYFICHKEQAYIMNCDKDEAYFSVQKACWARALVPECQIRNISSDVIAPPDQTSASAGTSFDCRNKKEDTRFAATEECANFYYECIDTDGAAQKVHCVRDQAFDPEKKQCVDIDKVPRCAKLAMLPSEATPTTDFNCNGKVGGAQPDPDKQCSDRYYFCMNNQAYVVKCQENHAFSKTKKECLILAQVSDCHNSNTQPSQPASRGSDTLTLPPNAKSADDKYSCKEEPEGINAHTWDNCADYYFFCQSGKAYEVDCPLGFFFSRIEKKCMNSSLDVECSHHHHIDLPSGSRVTTEFNCSQHEDNVIASPEYQCADRYIICKFTKAYLVKCKNGTVFDEEGIKTCVERKQLAGCNQENASATAEEMHKNAQLVADNEDCKDQKDYAILPPKQKCQNHYMVCKTKKTYRVNCDKDTAIDTVKKNCVAKQQISDCQNKQESTNEGSLNQPNVNPVNNSVVIPEGARRSNHFDCRGQTDGFLAVPDDNYCSDHYIICKGSLGYRVECASGTAVDESGKCVPQSEVLGCQLGFVPPNQPIITDDDDSILLIDYFNCSTTKCADTNESLCSDLKQQGACLSNPGIAFTMCQKTCRNCACKKCFDSDQIGVCENRFCERQKTQSQCPKTCGKCSIINDDSIAFAVIPEGARRSNHFDCRGQTDGFIALPDDSYCSDHYIICKASMGYRVDCPSGTAVDESGKCLPQAQIPGCQQGFVPPKQPIITDDDDSVLMIGYFNCSTTRCADTNESLCSDLKQQGACLSNPGIAFSLCQKTCRNCACKKCFDSDQIEVCENRFCERQKTQSQCPKSCGKCPTINDDSAVFQAEIPGDKCSDSVLCKSVTPNACITKPGFYLKWCKKSCNNCDGKTCFDSLRVNCAKLKNYCSSVEAVRIYCPKSCETC